MTSRYKRFLKLCRQWPWFGDRSKHVNAFGAYLERHVQDTFVYKDATQLHDSVKCDRTLESLERLITDFYKQKYTCFPSHTFSKTDPDNITAAVNQFILQTKEKDHKQSN